MMGSARIRSAFCIVLAFLPALLLLFRVDTAKAQGNLLSSPRRLITESIDETKVVRLEGNNVAAGKKTLAESGVAIITGDSMADAAQKVVTAVGQ